MLVASEENMKFFYSVNPIVHRRSRLSNPEFGQMSGQLNSGSSEPFVVR